MKKSLTLILAMLGLVFLAGCSTPTSRIKDNPEVFARFSPQEQEMIKKGQIALGFQPEMVKLALGNPDRIRVRLNSSGSTEVWSYTSYHADTTVYGGWGYGYYGGWGYPRMYAPYYGGWGWGGYGGWGYPYGGYSQPYEHFRVEFVGGRVTSIEQEES